jgi:uncharacterized protein (TIGR03792 family)
MVIEWLRVKVRPELRDRFLDKDEEIWTAWLARQDGFRGKEVWQGDHPEEIVLVVRWESLAHWKGIPQEQLGAIEERFRSELPKGAHQIVETRAWSVLRPAG